MDKKVEHVTWLEKQKNRAKHSLAGIVDSAKNVVFHNKTESKKHGKHTKVGGKKEENKSTVKPVTAGKKEILAAVIAKNVTKEAPVAPASPIIPSLSSFFSNWSSPGPHPQYAAETSAKKDETKTTSVVTK